MRQRPGGFTLVELMVSCMILGLLLTITFLMYRMGASAWLKSDAKSELLQIAQVVTSKFNRDVEGSSFRSASLAADGSGVAFLTAKDENGVFVYDPVTVMPRWQKYIVLYFQPDNKTLFRREVSVLGEPPEHAAMPIDSLGDPLESYFSGGQPMATKIDELRFSMSPDEQLVMEMSASKRRYGSATPERQSVRVVTSFRNQ